MNSKQIRRLTGVVATPITPLTPDGAIDHEAFAKLIEFQIAGGADSFAVPMHVGESLNLSTIERMELAETAVRVVNGRVPIFINCSLSGTDLVLELALHAQRVGADGVVVAAPYHWRPSPRALRAHYDRICSSLDIGVVAYNYPERLGVTVTVDLVAGLIERHPNFCGLKDASFRFDYFADLCALVAETEGRFAAFAGLEYLLPAITMGGTGSFSPYGEIAPRLVSTLDAAVRSGDLPLAQELQTKLARLDRAMMTLSPGYPGSIKAALEIMGRPVGGTRLPLLTADETEIAEIRKVIEELGLLESEPIGWTFE